MRMRVSRREFAWVFPQLSLLGCQTSSESCMRVDESLFSFFDFLVFLLVASTLLFLRFLTLVKLLTVRVITPTVTCRWYVIIFYFLLLVLLVLVLLLLLFLMGNDLEIACFCNSLRLSCNSHDRSNEPNLSLTLIKIWTSSKLMRVDESWRSNESESCDSHPLSSSLIHSHPLSSTLIHSHPLSSSFDQAHIKTMVI